MKSLMTKTMKALAVAGMTMGLAPGAQAADPVSYLSPVYKEIGGITSPTNGIERWETKSVTEYQFVTTSTAKLSAGWWVVDGTVARTSGITVEGAAHLILKDGCSLTVQGAKFCAGIKVSGDGNSLAIYGQSEGTGKLSATGGYDSAGIGGGDKGAGSNITINGGTVTATGGDGETGGAGIGGGSEGAGEYITINGGTVTAIAGIGGAGIGGGYAGAGQNISIVSGRVFATTAAIKDYGAADLIGCGFGSTSAASGNSISADAKVFFNLTGLSDGEIGLNPSPRSQRRSRAS